MTLTSSNIDKTYAKVVHPFPNPPFNCSLLPFDVFAPGSAEVRLNGLLLLLLLLLIPVVPHKAVAEVSKIGNL